jgi:linoleate 8R-lipoxygenase / 9,12-octadecadienoate 8-hydroperoxide 8S-isomerase
MAPLPEYRYEPGNDDITPETGLIQDVQTLGFKDLETMMLFLKAKREGVEDDNDLLLERHIQLLSKLPPHSHEGKKMTDGIVNHLWHGLPHPPACILETTHRYREADGSNNNIREPALGAANTPFARTTQPLVFQIPDALPDPGLIFDMILDRGNQFQSHPTGISSMLFYFAIIITHDIFQTVRSLFRYEGKFISSQLEQNSQNPNVNMASSYLDLSPLYGCNQEEQKAMRTFRDGLLKTDCFSSKKILGLPMGCGVFLIMFNRFHNYVVTQLQRY